MCMTAYMSEDQEEVCRAVCFKDMLHAFYAL